MSAKCLNDPLRFLTGRTEVARVQLQENSAISPPPQSVFHSLDRRVLATLNVHLDQVDRLELISRAIRIERRGFDGEAVRRERRVPLKQRRRAALVGFMRTGRSQFE